MDPSSLTPVMRILRGCLHLMLAALLTLSVVRAVQERVPHLTAVIVLAVVLGMVYAVGATWPRVRHSGATAAGWLLAVGMVWTALLVVSPEAVYLAFPLFFLQLHLLPTTWGLTAVVWTTLTAIAGFCWHRGGFAVGAVVGPSLGAAVAIAVVLGYQALYRESEQRRALIEELTAARGELAAAEREAGVLAERERLAREIHDTLAQGLSSIHLLLRATERLLPERAEEANTHVVQARETASSNLEEARRFVRALSPPDLENGSLPSALERLCASTSAATGPAVDWQLSGVPVPLRTAHEVALLRIAQSALANATQHADATRVAVTLSFMDTEVALDIVDDGVGFDPDTVSSGDRGFGLPGMRSRARSLQGTLVVESRPGLGTAVAVTVPLEVRT
ncbi:sensor histidine kinase [Rhodococcus sp. ARC_M5]|uniref:sensor histidine kinase n=1 Tax=Rhodococcus sp. ARC_M5 TaxID=2928851 RepID=UPI001FB4A646|nr:sensor histidine kinase [Rhodococcus sp. ARC_M5]MCJ0894159.1 sensor histidine kinase [Rhodococcus sp. ARC_M5]